MLKDDGKWSVLESIIGIQLILLMLKVAGFLSWNWFWVLTPIWFSGILLTVVLLVSIFLLDKIKDAIKSFLENRKKKNE